MKQDKASRAALEQARSRPFCELCWRPSPGRLEAHHVKARGFGNGTEATVRENLLGLCLSCHRAVHDEGTAGVLFRLVARREGRPVEEVKRIVREALKQ